MTSEAAQLFATERSGTLMVVDADENLKGVLSERDVVKGLDEYGADVMEKYVHNLCTARVISYSPETDLVELMALMETNHIRNLPVVENDRLIGVIRQGDVMNAWISVFDEENEQLRNQLSS